MNSALTVSYLASGRGAGRNGVGVEAAGTVGRPHQRTAHHAEKADLARFVGELVELLRFHPARHGMMSGRRPQVLRDGDEVAARVIQVAQRLADLVTGLAHAEDEVGL